MPGTSTVIFADTKTIRTLALIISSVQTSWRHGVLVVHSLILMNLMQHPCLLTTNMQGLAMLYGSYRTVGDH